jgi:16S rRNA (cytidine1402-2'-O)-methyltransferase
MAGTLFVVATPIGNLEDLTFRALRVLREVDLIAAEDTRRTAKLLARYEVRKPLVSLREHNEVRETPRLVARLSRGASIALVSDAGTPAIADPGARLVRAAREAGLDIVPVPGPSAITAALSVSGLEETSFVFMGFPPATGSGRTTWMEQLAAESRTVVFFESPHRIQRTAAEVSRLVKSQILIHHEISKINETFVVYQNNEVPAARVARGEFTVVVPPRTAEKTTYDPSVVYDLYAKLYRQADLSAELSLRLTALAFSLTEREAAKIIKKATIWAKQQNAPPA